MHTASLAPTLDTPTPPAVIPLTAAPLMQVVSGEF